MVNEIISIGLLPNQRPVAGRVNPMECNTYFHQIETKEILEPNEELIDWKFSIEGEVPKDLTIDPKLGIIKGEVLTFDKQLYGNKRPKEDLSPGGDNWLNNGRLDGATYTFNFTVNKWCEYKVYPPLGSLEEPEIKESIAISNCSILVIQNNDIDNLMFAINYLKSGAIFKLGEEKFKGLEDSDKFIKEHPGPFGCGRK